MAELQGRAGKASRALATAPVVTFMNEVLELVMRRHIFAVFYPR